MADAVKKGLKKVVDERKSVKDVLASPPHPKAAPARVSKKNAEAALVAREAKVNNVESYVADSETEATRSCADGQVHQYVVAFKGLRRCHWWPRHNCRCMCFRLFMYFTSMWTFHTRNTG